MKKKQPIDNRIRINTSLDQSLTDFIIEDMEEMGFLRDKNKNLKGYMEYLIRFRKENKKR